MFVKAIRIASVYTYPVIISKMLVSGKIVCGCGSFIILNSDGWALTASHIMNDFHTFEAQKKQREENMRFRLEIEGNPNLNAKQKKRQLAQIRSDPNEISQFSYWWANDEAKVVTAMGDALMDIAVLKLEGFPPIAEDAYPIFMDKPLGHEEESTGRSLCRLGFPFHDISATYDERNSKFVFAQGTLPLPRFPNDGILTRRMILVDRQSGRSATFIETSTPGLRGQSGGPIFDIDGQIWGVQSQTSHLPLGFSPTFRINGKDVSEHQFLNVGLGLHASEILAFLKANGIKVRVTSE